ncbi:uncharacterized protein LOC133193830 [Saccostrea echinata]|uniref:uncharacterized protein LOC133193830 n=1 Tax=Saccostrea echinata TaxID=191078 RepID=UPI002A81CD75|nr:uncharacterized protein LOC133193830 [Saccostrea echinata]
MDLLENVIKLGISPVESLQVLTCMFAGIFAGCSLYVAVVEAPSRVDLPIHSLWEQWATSFKRGAIFIPILSLCMAMSSGAVYYLSSSSPVRTLWLVPVGSCVFSVIYTAIVMGPEIKILLEKDVITKKGNDWTKQAIARWVRRHYIRVVAILITFLVSVFAAVKS